MKTKYISTFAAVAVIVFLIAFIACNSGKNKEYTETFFAMDTVMSITAYGPQAEEGINKARQEINRLDQLLSVNNENGITYRINTAGQDAVSVADEPDVKALIEEALTISRLTAGSFDITIGPLVKAWGFTEEEFNVPDDFEIKKLLEKVDFNNIEIGNDSITLKNDSRLDFGAIAKGYAADAAVKALKDAGVKKALVNLGGNIYALGTDEKGEDWIIGIKDPYSEEAILGRISVTDRAVVTSGNYERYFEKDGKRYWHILDPETGYPADSGLVSVTIISDNSTYADAMSTAAFVMGAEKTKEIYELSKDFEYILVTKNGELITSEGVSLK